MGLLFECIKCHTKLKIDEKYMGKKVKCPNCGFSREMTRDFLVADDMNITFDTQSRNIKSADLVGKSKYKQRVMANRAQQGLPTSGYKPIADGTKTNIYYQKVKESEGMKRVFAVLVLALVAYYVHYSLKKEKFVKMSVEAKVLLTAYHDIQTQQLNQYARYEAGLDLDEFYKSKGFTYRIVSNMEKYPVLKEVCPDCLILDKSFKVLAVKNLDSDDTFDVWSIDEKKEVIHLVDDFDNSINQ